MIFISGFYACKQSSKCYSFDFKFNQNNLLDRKQQMLLGKRHLKWKDYSSNRDSYSEKLTQPIQYIKQKRLCVNCKQQRLRIKKRRVSQRRKTSAAPKTPSEAGAAAETQIMENVIVHLLLDCSSTWNSIVPQSVPDQYKNRPKDIP